MLKKTWVICRASVRFGAQYLGAHYVSLEPGGDEPVDVLLHRHQHLAAHMSALLCARLEFCTYNRRHHSITSSTEYVVVSSLNSGDRIPVRDGYDDWDMNHPALFQACVSETFLQVKRTHGSCLTNAMTRLLSSYNCAELRQAVS